MDETFRVQTTASRRWKWQAAILLTVSGMAFSMLTLQSRGLAAQAYAAADATRSDAVQTYHAKFAVSRGTGEMWVQLKPDGTPIRGRVDYLKTEDGDKLVFLSAGKAAVWFRTKNGYNVFPETGSLDRIRSMRDVCDPVVVQSVLRPRGRRARSRWRRSSRQRRAISWS